MLVLCSFVSRLERRGVKSSWLTTMELSGGGLSVSKSYLLITSCSWDSIDRFLVLGDCYCCIIFPLTWWCFLGLMNLLALFCDELVVFPPPSVDLLMSGSKWLSARLIIVWFYYYYCSMICVLLYSDVFWLWWLLLRDRLSCYYFVFAMVLNYWT